MEYMPLLQRGITYRPTGTECVELIRALREMFQIQAKPCNKDNRETTETSDQVQQVVQQQSKAPPHPLYTTATPNQQYRVRNIRENTHIVPRPNLTSWGLCIMYKRESTTVMV